MALSKGYSEAKNVYSDVIGSICAFTKFDILWKFVWCISFYPFSKSLSLLWDSDKLKRYKNFFDGYKTYGMNKL